MVNCFSTEKKDNAIPIILVPQKDFPAWKKSQSELINQWLEATQFQPDVGNFSLLPNAKEGISQVVCCVSNQPQLWDIGNLPLNLPKATYFLAPENEFYADYLLGWGLGAYQFTRYKKPKREPAKLYTPANAVFSSVENKLKALYLVRDLINTPTDDMGPTQFAEAAGKVAKHHHAKFKQIIGEDLLKQNYPCIYTVGRASDDDPRLLDLRWGNTKHPRVTLVGKGVCFDSGGLDIKPAAYMQLMKKDMAGGAHVLGLAQMIMTAQLPICLRVLIPVVENVISGNAYRPGDIIKSRKGMTIEVGNTDAEGRVILADALTEAVSEKPELLIDITTLTGAARVALGTELPAVFSNQNTLVDEVIKAGEKVTDPMWRLPLFPMYREYLYSQIADINNNASEPYGGAITAALFLKEFVPDDIPWLHFDLMAWNLRSRPGRPQGGEAMVLRALFSYLSKRFAQ